jgi:site-specific recombinase XerD
MDTQLPLGATLDIKTLEQAIDLFVTDGMPARNLSPQTRKNYRHDLLDLLAFLTTRGASTLSDLSLRHLEAYQAEMDRRGYSASTHNRKTHSSKSLFHLLHRLGITSHNIAEKLIPPSVQKHEPRFLSEAEYQRLLRECSHKPRDAAIIEVFLQTGMRLSELAKLQLHDVEIPKRITPDPDNMGYVQPGSESHLATHRSTGISKSSATTASNERSCARS